MAQIVRLESVYQSLPVHPEDHWENASPNGNDIGSGDKIETVVPNVYLSDLYIVSFKDVRCESS